ncbi:MAG TPA: hypothetical protein VNC61_15750 [Acidimicrobiales bacterium]|nr:hypothetical protein [Acidimicrobiales bacterium]
MGFFKELLDELAEADEQKAADRSWWTLPPAFFLPWQVTIAVGMILVGVAVATLITGHDLIGFVILVLAFGWTASGLVRHQVRIRQRQRRGRQARREHDRVQRRKSE